MENLKKKTVKISSIKKGSVIDLKISEAFHQRLLQTYEYFIKSQDNKEVLKAISMLTSNPGDSELSYCLETFLILIKTINSEFEKKGFIESKDEEIEFTEKDEEAIKKYNEVLEKLRNGEVPKD